MAQYGWYINLDSCIACRACEAACKQEFNVPVGMRRRQVLVREGTAPSGRPYRQNVTMACNHCGTPACAGACPVGRYTKDPVTGLVIIKPSRAKDPVNGVDCLACKRCVAACPYGAARFDEVNGVADKCTGCHHRLTNASLPAERRKPACVVTCTAFALHFDTLDRITDGTTYGAVETTTWGSTTPADALEIADPALTAPSVRYTPQKLR
jgi:anaerobic dimethyl sulfoxide reductase subunit B (iron-sulfur subunit)